MQLLFCLLITASIFSPSKLQSQNQDSLIPVNFPLVHEDFSLFETAEIRLETKHSRIPTENIKTGKFLPVRKIFSEDNLLFSDSVETAWFKFSIRNTLPTDTSIALVFPGSVSKAVLFKGSGDELIYVGKTGWVIAVVARSVADEWGRIDLPLKRNSTTTFFMQVPRTEFLICLKAPALRSVTYADSQIYKWVKETQRPALLWSHFFAGVFFMFFLFGLIKYMVLGKDRAYIYYSMMGLSNAVLTITQAEYPPVDFRAVENLRGIELFNFVNAICILMQGLFILEILQLKKKYPRVDLATKFFLYAQLFVSTLFTAFWIAHVDPNWYKKIYFYQQFLLLLMFYSWAIYLSTIRKGFYKYIFFGALTISLGFTFHFLVQFFELYYLLPSWLGEDKRGSVNHFIQLALVIDMCFYFAGLAFRDLQVEKDKNIFQKQLITQLEANSVLQEKFTSELEQQVKENTQELLTQREALETQKQAKILAEFERKFSESELKALRSQMNPHFVFNILNTIESYSLENNKEAVSDMIQKFSKLTRLVLENSMNQLVPFQNDWKSLQLYIELEQMRYADKFVVLYNVQDEITEQDFFIPPMIIQPFVENAIVHGLRNKANGNGILDLSASLQNGYIVVQVKDNGIGREKAALLKANNPIQKKSLGIKVTRDRISMFNNLNHDKKAKVEIQDLSEGTEVLICLPATN